jgi:hypothetical protein
MVRTPTVLIYGHDGFDPDVVRNLRSFYGQLGFRCFQSRRLLPADVLCIIRAPESEMRVPAYSQIHLFDYVGKDVAQTLSGYAHPEDVHIFSSSPARVARIRELISTRGMGIHVQLPPVDVLAWRKRRARECFGVVHIGNYKPYYSEANADPFASRFLSRIQDGSVKVWGRGWQGIAPRHQEMGRAALRNVSSIYARSKVALGMMYPFQRNETISGRYWHAPLNGCALLTELNSGIDHIPGVYQTDYTEESIGAALDVAERDRASLQDSATEYWRTHFDVALAKFDALLDPARRRAGEHAREKRTAYNSNMTRDGLRAAAQVLRLR